MNRGPAAGPANRRALLDAAREVFAESGLGAPLSAIARRAGVGQGSLYRHFPDRTALAAAVFEENLLAVEAATRARESTLEDLLDRIIEQALASTVLIELVTSDPDDARVLPLAEHLRGIVERVVARERATGRMSEAIETGDVLVAIEMLAGAIARSAPERRPEIAARGRRVFLAAVRP